MFTIKIKKTDTDFVRFQIKTDIKEWLEGIEETYNENQDCDGHVCYLDFPLVDVVDSNQLHLARFLNIHQPLTMMITNQQTNENHVFHNVDLRDVIVYDKDLDWRLKSVTVEFEFQRLIKLVKTEGEIYYGA